MVKDVSGFKTLFKIASVIAIASGLNACAYDVEDVRVRSHRIRYEPIYDESRCHISKTQGDDVIVSNTEKLVVSEFFGKRYNRSMLESVLTASAVATGRYVSEVLGGRVYRIPRDTMPGAVVCPMFTELPVAPDDLRELWDRFAGGGIGGWRLAGLYFEDCGRDGFACDDRVMVRPTILIDEARDRWTLVHEMMHFNFSRERKLDPQMPPLSTLAMEAAASKKAVKDLFAAYRAEPKRELLSKLQAHSSWLLRQWFYHTMVHTVLEEIAVEGLLLDEFLAKRLRNVSPNSLEIALMYMERSFERMLTEYEAPVIREVGPSTDISLRSLRTFIYNEATKHKWKEILSSVQADIAFFSRWELSIRKSIDKRRGRVFAYFREFPFMRLSGEANSVVNQFQIIPKTAAAEDHSPHFEHTPEWQLFEAWKD